MKVLKRLLTCFPITCYCLTVVLLSVHSYGEEQDRRSCKLVSHSMEIKLENSARNWIGRLWTNNYSECTAFFNTRRYDTSSLVTHVNVEFRLQDKLCVLGFIDGNPDKLVYVRNDLYASISYQCKKIHTPEHTTKEQAQKKATEYAHLFGVSNLWETTNFSSYFTAFDPREETWEFGLFKIINGYLCPHGVSISIADKPGAPLHMWQNDLIRIPSQLSTNVVLSAEQASCKALQYMRKYFPFKDAALFKGEILQEGEIPQVKCYTNRLEYVIPNYNYIRPASASDGLSAYVPKEREIALVWANYLGTVNSDYDIDACIYVDAATGEMLGGF